MIPFDLKDLARLFLAGVAVYAWRSANEIDDTKTYAIIGGIFGCLLLIALYLGA